MKLTARDIAKTIDLSCVRTTSSRDDIEEMVEGSAKIWLRAGLGAAMFHPLHETATQGLN